MDDAEETAAGTLTGTPIDEQIHAMDDRKSSSSPTMRPGRSRKKESFKRHLATLGKNGVALSSTLTSNSNDDETLRVGDSTTTVTTLAEKINGPDGESAKSDRSWRPIRSLISNPSEDSDASSLLPTGNRTRTPTAAPSAFSLARRRPRSWSRTRSEDETGPGLSTPSVNPKVPKERVTSDADGEDGVGNVVESISPATTPSRPPVRSMLASPSENFELSSPSRLSKRDPLASTASTLENTDLALTTPYDVSNRLSEYPTQSLPTNASEDSEAPTLTMARSSNSDQPTSTAKSIKAKHRLIAKQRTTSLGGSRSVDDLINTTPTNRGTSPAGRILMRRKAGTNKGRTDDKSQSGSDSVSSPTSRKPFPPSNTGRKKAISALSSSTSMPDIHAIAGDEATTGTNNDCTNISAVSADTVPPDYEVRVPDGIQNNKTTIEEKSNDEGKQRLETPPQEPSTINAHVDHQQNDDETEVRINLDKVANSSVPFDDPPLELAVSDEMSTGSSSREGNDVIENDAFQFHSEDRHPVSGETATASAYTVPLPLLDGTNQASNLVFGNLVQHGLEYSGYDDPLLEDVESEVSVGFDMRSIHDHIPLDHRSTPSLQRNAVDPTWETSNVIFEDMDENKDDIMTQFENIETPWQQQPTSSDVDIEEKKEKELVEMSESHGATLDNSWDVTSAPQFATPVLSVAKGRTSDGLDMFDTSLWAGTEVKYSDSPVSELIVNTQVESMFVELMIEEMAARELTDDEKRMVFEAQINLSQAEERSSIERMAAQKDDVPLMGLVSTSDDGATIDNTVSLDDRIKQYVTSSDHDTDSIPDDDDCIDEKDEDNFQDGEEVVVDYVPHEEDLDDDENSTGAGRNNSTKIEVGLIFASDVSTFEAASCAAETAHFPSTQIPTTLEELKYVIPPPPPPATSRRKKKNKSNTSDPRSKSGLPLLAPPPEEKLSKWQEGLTKSDSYNAAMKEKLGSETTKATSAPDESFRFFRGEDTEAVSNTYHDQAIEVPTIAFGIESEGAVSPSCVVAEEHLAEASGTNAVEISDTNLAKTTFVGDVLLEEVVNKEAVVKLFDEFVEKENPEINEFLSGIDEDVFHRDKSSVDDSDAPIEYEEFKKTQDGDEILFSRTYNSDLMEVDNRTAGNHHECLRSVITDQKMADKVASARSEAACTFEKRFSTDSTEGRTETSLTATRSGQHPRTSLSGFDLMYWYSETVLERVLVLSDAQTNTSDIALSLLGDEEKFNKMCHYLADCVNDVTKQMKAILRSNSTISSFDDTTVNSDEDEEKADGMFELKRPWLKPVVLSSETFKLSPNVLAANFVSFMYMVAKLTKVESPFGDHNPFLTLIVESSLGKKGMVTDKKTPQELIVSHLSGKSEILIDFVYQVSCACDTEMAATMRKSYSEVSIVTEHEKLTKLPGNQGRIPSQEVAARSKRFIVPDGRPSPFETCIWEVPRIVAAVLSFCGDPAAVCRMKMVNRFCFRVVAENEHMLMQNAVRSGGIDMSVRPAFWMWITLQKCGGATDENIFNGKKELQELERCGEEGKWHHVIQRDVARSFGNMPPHKTGARMRTDSIVRALVTWGQNRIMKRGVKGGGEPQPLPDIGPKSSRKQKLKPKTQAVRTPPWECIGEHLDDASVRSEVSESPTDTVSDWGAVSPKGSFAGSVNEPEPESFHDRSLSGFGAEISVEELALSGNSLTADVKLDLQNKLGFILHSLAATHEDIGYCQGMDYVVAHLLRILQETIRWQAAKQSLPSVISTARELKIPVTVIPENLADVYHEIDSNLVVEETVLRVMDTFFVNYNLRHMYWPELRCLKTFCRVFERLIQIKLPVLADHFEHHDLNVGLFALGWFQTLFLYLPSMPSATVCHMWDIWLVERSFKIFFRVGTAILFLSQPILLNHELEGMMTYLNTIPDATLLRPDILIPCALNIKVTNRMLQKLEAEVMKQP